MNITLPEQGKQLLTTTTGELLQPVRLHYDLLNKKEMIRIFNKLGCIDFDTSKRRWTWVYARESSSLKFKWSYNDLPKEARRVVLGSFFITSDTEMHLDLRSVERALAAVGFFDQRIPHSVAKLSHLSILNRLLSDPKELPEDFDLYFDREEARNFDRDAFQEEAIKNVQAGIERPLPEVETFPVNYYEEGLNQMKLALFARQTVAFKRFEGDAGYSFEDYVRGLMKSRPSE